MKDFALSRSSTNVPPARLSALAAVFLISWHILGCATDGPGMSLVYERFEPAPKGGKILVFDLPKWHANIRDYQKMQQKIMKSVCSPEGFRVTDIGIEAPQGEMTSLSLPLEEGAYERREYINFVCGKD